MGIALSQVDFVQDVYSPTITPVVAVIVSNSDFNYQMIDGRIKVSGYIYYQLTNGNTGTVVISLPIPATTVLNFFQITNIPDGGTLMVFTPNLATGDLSLVINNPVGGTANNVQMYFELMYS